MTHYITPGNIFLTVISLAALIAAIRYSGKMFVRFSGFFETHRRAIFAVLPIIGCNGTAFTGQLFFFRDHAKSWPLIGVILFAATMESIALYLAHEAAEREKKNVASFNVRMASYAFGLFVGTINYSHYAGADFRPTVFALIFGSMSALSPWLWAMYGRGQAYEIQLQTGLIEARGVKFAKARWLMWPVQTFSASRLAAWTGERNPEKAIKDYEEFAAKKRASDEEREKREREEKDALLTLENAPSQAEAIRIAFNDLGEDATPVQIVDYLASAQPRAWSVTAARVRQVKSAQARAASAPVPVPLRAIP
jgi:hypothetical protein